MRMMSLIEFVSQWIKSISMIFIIVSIIELVIPNSNLKKYVNMFIGLLIIIAIITPIVNLLDSNYDIEKEVFKNIIEGVEIQNINNEDILLAQEKQIKELYINRLRDDVYKSIKEITDYEIFAINISIYEDKVNYGNIKDMEIVLKDKINENVEDNSSIKVINIEEISLESLEKDKDSNLESEREKIVEHIYERYNISKNNIKVFINTMEEGEK
ncbi:MAG: stage III sporulation protein AF [Tissierellia bacterium]|nr:stage III sporulation protein AF [Tissierellia bacterium]